jgi:uncharacterized DUF497 family protein
MRFSWDEAKRKSNLRKHLLDFTDAEKVFISGITFTFEDDRFDYGEQRFVTIGILAGEIVVIAHTERDETTRIISMRKATKYEQIIFIKALGN